MRQRQPRIKEENHLRFIASCPCLICGGTDVQAAHIRFADLTIDKPYTGKGEKPDDKYTVPLCVYHHAAQHKWGNEREWWANTELDPIKVALALYAVSGDQERGEHIVRACLGRVPA